MELVKSLFDLCRHWQFEISDTSLYYVVTIFSVYYVSRSCEKRIKESFIYPCILTFLVLFNPFTIELLCTYIGEFHSRYQRVYWLIPYTVLIAYAFVLLYETLKEKRKRLFMIAFLLAITILSSANRDAVYHVENIYNVQNSLIEVAEYFENAGKKGIYVFYADKDMYLTSRQYTAAIMVPGWSIQLDLSAIWERLVYSEEEYGSFVNMLKNAGIEYIVVQRFLNTGDLELYFEFETEINRGYIYRVL